MNAKQCIDKTMSKIVKSIRLPKDIISQITTEVRVVNNKTCYCVIIDNSIVSTVGMELFYTRHPNIIRSSIEADIEQHLDKLYSKSKYENNL